MILYHTGLCQKENGSAVDVGAGTGIWTRQILDRGIRCVAVEPNEDMRKNGIEYTKEYSSVTWKAGSGENTGLEEKSLG